MSKHTIYQLLRVEAFTEELTKTNKSNGVKIDCNTSMSTCINAIKIITRTEKGIRGRRTQ